MGDVDVWKNPASDDHDNVNIQRYSEPPTGLDEDMTNRWQKLVGRQFPYNAVARSEDGLMKIDAVVAPAVTNGKSAHVLYTAFYGIAGAHPQTDMKSKLDLLMKTVKVRETQIDDSHLVKSAAVIGSKATSTASESQAANR